MELQRGLKEAFILNGLGDIELRGERSYLFEFEKPNEEQIKEAVDDVVLINDFNNNDYACVMYTNTATGEDAGSFANDYLGGLLDRTTGSVGTTSYGSSPTDASLNDVIFHGDLA